MKRKAAVARTLAIFLAGTCISAARASEPSTSAQFARLRSRVEDLERSLRTLQRRIGAPTGSGAAHSGTGPAGVKGSSAERDEIAALLHEAIRVEGQLRTLQRRTAVSAALPKRPAGQEAAAQDRASRGQEYRRLLSTAFARSLIGHGGLLLAPGVFQITPGFTYIHSSSNDVVIDGFTVAPILVVGSIFSQRINRDDLLQSMQLTAGLPWDSQIDVSVPYGFEWTRTAEADNQQIDSRVSGIGDAQLTVSHQILHAHGSWPDLMASLRWKSDTGADPYAVGAQSEVGLGTGFNSYQASVTAITVNDPLVFYTTASYTWTAPRRQSIGRVSPGASAGIQLGMTVALNLDASMYFGYSQSFTESTHLNGTKVPNSYLSVGMLTIGVNYALGRDTTLVTNLGIGLTADAPDVQLNVQVPVLFGQ